MLTSFDYLEFTEALAIGRRAVVLDALRLRSADADAPSPAEAATTSLLDQTLGFLAIAEEGLRAQNDALFAARVEADEMCDHFRRLFDLAPVSYLVTDLAGMILEVNVAAAELLGHEANALVGRLIASYVDHDDHDAFDTALDRSAHSDRVEEWPVRLASLRGPSRDYRVNTRVVTVWPAASASMYWMLHDDTGRQIADLL